MLSDSESLLLLSNLPASHPVNVRTVDLDMNENQSCSKEAVDKPLRRFTNDDKEVRFNSDRKALKPVSGIKIRDVVVIVADDNALKVMAVAKGRNSSMEYAYIGNALIAKDNAPQ